MISKQYKFCEYSRNLDWTESANTTSDQFPIYGQCGKFGKVSSLHKLNQLFIDRENNCVMNAYEWHFLKHMPCKAVRSNWRQFNIFRCFQSHIIVQIAVNNPSNSVKMNFVLRLPSMPGEVVNLLKFSLDYFFLRFH